MHTSLETAGEKIKWINKANDKTKSLSTTKVKCKLIRHA